MSNDDFERVASLSELGLETIRAYEVDGQKRLLIRTRDGDLRALDGVCTHEDADLSDGDLEDNILWCPLHAAGFDIENGAPICPPAVNALRSYAIRTVGDDVMVSRTSSTSVSETSA